MTFGNVFFFSNCSALNEILRLVTRDGPTHQDRGKLIQPRPRTLTQRCSPPPPSPPLLPQIGRNWLRRPRPGWDWSKLCLGGDGPLACLPFICHTALFLCLGYSCCRMGGRVPGSWLPECSSPGWSGWSAWSAWPVWSRWQTGASAPWLQFFTCESYLVT